MPSRTERIRAEPERREQLPSRRASRGNGSSILPNAQKIQLRIHNHTCTNASNYLTF